MIDAQRTLLTFRVLDDLKLGKVDLIDAIYELRVLGHSLPDAETMALDNTPDDEDDESKESA